MIDILILAAGKGTRMQSDLPKVLHEISGKPMLEWVVDSLESAGQKSLTLILSPEPEPFNHFLEKHPNCRVVVQNQRRGTGDAVAAASCAYDNVKSPYFADGKLLRGKTVSADHVFVCYGDVPAISSAEISEFIEGFLNSGCDLGIIGMEVPDPTGYGRLLIQDQKLTGIIEEKDANAEQKKITLCNTGIIIAKAETLFQQLNSIKNENTQKEYYLTDCFCHEGKIPTFVYQAKNWRDFNGVNDKSQLQEVSLHLENR